MDLTALPYVDTDIDHDSNLKSMVKDLIETEVKASGGHDVLLQQYLDRIVEDESPRKNLSVPPLPIRAIDLSRYDLQTVNKRVRPAEAAEVACTVLEYEHMKQTNLLLLSQVGRDAWKAHNAVLEQEVARKQQTLQSLIAETSATVTDRERVQKAIGSELEELNERWGSLAYSSAVLRGALKAKEGSAIN